MANRWDDVAEGEEATPASINDRLNALRKGDEHNIKAYGGVGDGVTDDTTALEDAAAAAIAAGTPLTLPEGTFCFSSPQTWTNLRGMVGKGILKPTSALDGQTCITINTTVASIPQDLDWDHVVIDGALTSGSVGVHFGSNTISSALRLKGGMVRGFSGSGGRGIRVENMVVFTATDSFVTSNYVNVEINGDAGFPTTTRFSGCYINQAVTTGVLVKSGDQIVFDQNTVFESNGERGLYVLPDAGQSITQVILNDCWFENNWTSLSGAPRLAEYAIEAGDGSPIIANFEMHRCRYGETCRVAKLNNVIDGVIDAPYRPGALAQDFEILNSSVVHLVNWPLSLPTTFAYLGKASTAAVMLEGAILSEQSVNWDPVPAGDVVTADYAIAEYGTISTFLGMKADLSIGISQGGLEVWGYVSAADTLTVYLRNPTGSPIDLGATTLRARLWR